MTEIEEKKAIWQHISGADELHEIYGYFPTLHDAMVENIDVRFDSKEVVFTVKYSDLVQKSPETIERGDAATTRFQICWQDVQQAKLKLYAEDLLGVSLHRAGDFIETRFREYTFGFDGFIIARSIVVRAVEEINDVDTKASDSGRGIQISIEN